MDLETTFSTSLDFQPTSVRHEAGITVYLSIHYHNEIAVTLHPDDSSKRVVVAKTRTGQDATLNATYYDIPADGPVGLFIDAKTDGYMLGYSVDGGDPTYVASVENRWLQAYVAGWQNFVGTHLGVYATGNQLSMLVHAVRPFRVGRACFLIILHRTSIIFRQFCRERCSLYTQL